MALIKYACRNSSPAEFPFRISFSKWKLALHHPFLLPCLQCFLHMLIWAPYLLLRFPIFWDNQGNDVIKTQWTGNINLHDIKVLAVSLIIGIYFLLSIFISLSFHFFNTTIFPQVPRPYMYEMQTYKKWPGSHERNFLANSVTLQGNPKLLTDSLWTSSFLFVYFFILEECAHDFKIKTFANINILRDFT